MLRVVTYNIHFGKRLIDIISWIDKQTDADIICLQEFPAVHRKTFYRSLPRRWGHRYTQSFIFRKKTYAIVTLFRKKTLRMVKTKILLLGTHPMEKSLMRNPMEKSCLVTTFRSGAKTVTVVNTHLVFLAANRSRYKQIKMITDHLLSYRHPLIITGDFNIVSLRSKNTLMSYMKKLGFVSIAKRLSSYRLSILKYQLDYVFVQRCALASLAIEKVRFSDHYPVIAQVTL
jgi:endonuclease/exonuclease/phosphatase family metal-dependent hydrolase